MIRSPHNARLKDIRRLRRRQGDREVRDVVLLEGPHLVAEALTCGLELESVLATPDGLASLDARPVLDRLARPPLLVEARLLDELADSDSPRGLVATARLPRGGAAALPVTAGVHVFAEGLQDPGNLGALARVAEAAGAAGLCLSPGSCHPNHPRALRASAGSLLRLPVAIAGAGELDARLAEVAPRWVALAPRDGESFYAADLTGPLIVAVGAEGPGLSAATLARADLAVTIPLAGRVESLNATVAAALVLFEIRRRVAA